MISVAVPTIDRPGCRRVKRTPESCRHFIAMLEISDGVIARAADLSRISVETIRRWRKVEPEFENQVLWAIFNSGERGRSKALKRATKGFLKPLLHDGEPCFTETRTASGILISRQQIFLPNVPTDEVQRR